MMIAAAMGYQVFVVKEMVTVTTTLNVLVPWYVAQTTAPGVTEMTVVNSQVCRKNVGKNSTTKYKVFQPKQAVSADISVSPEISVYCNGLISVLVLRAFD